MESVKTWEEELRATLKDLCEASSQRRWAKENGFGYAFINKVILGKARVSTRLAEALGFRVERVVVKNEEALAVRVDNFVKILEFTPLSTRGVKATTCDCATKLREYRKSQMKTSSLTNLRVIAACIEVLEGKDFQPYV